ncbi:MAG: replicative DNA helicase [Aristaeellaceae bacterium]
MFSIFGGTGEAPVNAFYNIEAEVSTLGAALLDGKCAKVLADISSDIYYDQRHQLIHAAVCALVKDKKPVDLVTMDHEMASRNTLDAIGGAAYLVRLCNAVPTTANMKYYLQIVQACAMRRKMRIISQELNEKLADPLQDPNEIREWAARSVREVRLGDTEKLISIYDACMATYEQLEADQQKPDEPTKKIMSGISTLDNKLGGLRGGEYVAIGARPSVGKSILALTFCVAAAKQGKRVLLVSLEMNEVQITERIMADQGDVPLNMITSGNLDMASWDGLAKAVGPISGLPLWYSLEANTVEKVRRAAYQLYENGGLDMIAVDYLQLMEATYSKRQSRQEQISEISRGLRLLAAELKIPILVLTQLNRSSVNERVDGKKVKREPTMSEARESGAIEQDANIFILLHDPSKNEMTSDSEREMWENLDKQGMTMMRLIVDKNRQGKRGRLTVAFDGDHMRFLPIVRKD